MREQVKQKSVLKFLEAFSVNKSKKGLSKACQRNAWSGSGSGSIFFFFLKKAVLGSGLELRLILT